MKQFVFVGKGFMYTLYNKGLVFSINATAVTAAAAAATAPC